MTSNERLKKLADRYALVMTYLEAHFGTTAPFDDDLFWMTDDAMEIRSMPEYQDQLEALRVAL